MANRYFNSKFWDDEYIHNLAPEEKTVFIYLFTNSLVNLSGIYEIAQYKIAFDTGVGNLEVVSALHKFESDGKVFYVKGWMVVCNYLKNQKQNSPTLQKNALVRLKEVPEDVIDQIKKHDNFKKWERSLPRWFKQNLDRLSIGYR